MTAAGDHIAPAGMAPANAGPVAGADGFRRPAGMRYRPFLTRLHGQMLFDWYLEIGSRKGDSVAPSRSKTIAIDPYFRVTLDIIGAKPQLSLFQTTSDDFFDSGYLARNDIRLSFAFLDGMHLFEYLLRDFMNAEDAADPNGVIALHDCCPFSHEMTTRDLDALTGDAWTGDVWKLIPILQHYRPDLTLTVLDCRPTGLVLISGLKPGDRRLRDAYDRIIADWTGVTLADYGAARFYGSFDYTSGRDFLTAGFPLFAGVALDEAEAYQPKVVST